jgi:hypothetical protein
MEILLISERHVIPVAIGPVLSAFCRYALEVPSIKTPSSRKTGVELLPPQLLSNLTLP